MQTGRGAYWTLASGNATCDSWMDLKPIAERLGKTMAQLAIRWALSSGAVDVALVSSLTVTELEENLGFLGWALSGEDMRQIDEVFERHGVDAYPNQGLNP